LSPKISLEIIKEYIKDCQDLVSFIGQIDSHDPRGNGFGTDFNVSRVVENQPVSLKRSTNIQPNQGGG
jgi:hypothetical protein